MNFYLQQKLLFFYFISSSLLFLYCTGKVHSSSTNGVVVSKDVEKLLAFKSKLINPSVLQNWVQNQDPCYFTGVVCNGNNNKDSVLSLDLSFINLNTDFKFVSLFLFSLESIEKLSLRFSNLTGNLSSLSSSSSSCSVKLQELDLSGNGLTGSISDISSLSYCSNLVSLNLSRNLLGGGENKEYSSTGLKLQSLQKLDLSSNNFTGKIPSLSSLGVLNHLDLSVNKFSGDIGRYFSGSKSLSYLNLSYNEFSGRIPVISSGNLQYLLLSTNKFDGEIPQELTDSCTTLMEIDLSSNQLVGSLPSGLGSCTSLQHVSLSNNNFSGDFPSNTLIQMINLKKLVLSYNYFNGEVPDSVSKLANLEMLDLSANNLSGMIPSGLCENKESNLKELYLQNNMFTGIVPPSLSKCSKLITLDLSSNYLTGTIPSSFGSLSQLRDLIMWLNQLTGEIPTELMNIKTLENLILDNNGLTGGIPSGLSNCTNLNWISLSSNLLSGEIPPWIGKLNKLAILKLGNNSFSGPIPPEVGDCRSLIWLDLNSNNLSGSIPATISKQAGNIAGGLVAGKRYVYLKNDGSPSCHGAGSLLEFAGIRPEGLDRVPTRRQCNTTRVYMGNTQYTFNNNGSMIFMDLSYNALENSIPKELGDLYYLSVLNLGHNNLSGPIPTHFGNLKNVGVLDLSFNKLEGPIPGSLSGLSLLAEIDLSNNRLSGLIPEGGQLATFPPYRYQNNDGLCGYPLPPCGDLASNSSASSHPKSHRRQASLAGSVAMGLLFSLFCIFGVIIVMVERNKRQKKKEAAALDVYIDSRSHSGTAHTNWKLTSVREALSINLSTFDKPLRKLTFADLLQATNGFHNDSLIGSGGFGDVYKARLKDGSIVAVKKLIQISGQGDREFTAEMETIGKIKHRNLVPLLGYCKVGEERLLVYEYMKFGSLEDVLHERKKVGIKLKWAARRKIAIGAARGLAFLHHNCIPHIIHRDMKSSNVLLDENLEARVSDFGMARLMSAMDTHLSVSTLAGTPGYVPPEYYQSFRCSTKGDVYSYGVVLLELLSGKQPTDSEDFGDNNLVGWVKQHAKLKISDVFDPELLKEDPTLEIELLQHLKVACACLDDRPWRRPTMIQVMAMFKEIQAGSSIDSSVSTIDQDGSFHTIDMVEMTIKEGQELNTSKH